MRVFILVFLLISTSWAKAEEVRLKGGTITFTAPDGFRSQSREEIALKYPRGNAPSVVYSNASGGVSIAVTFSSTKITPAQLPDLKAFLEQALPRLIPNLQWLKREIIISNGTSWVHFDLMSPAIDTDIHNHMYFTSHQGETLGFNFNSTVKAYSSHQQLLSDSFKTIRVRE